MVKLSAPALSIAASGKLGGALVFSNWKGRAYARTLVTPANPKSGLQVGMRSMFKFLSQEWNGLAAPAKAAWVTAAAAMNVSPFNAYMKLGLERWRRFTSPWQGDDVDEGGTIPVFSNLDVAGGPRHAVITIETTTANDEWGICLFRSPTGTYDTALSNCVAVIPTDGTNDVVYLDSPLDAGTYYYDIRYFTDDGVLGAEEGEISDTVT